MSEPKVARAAGRKPGPWTDETEALLGDWKNRTAAAAVAHYGLATRLRRRNLWLGVPAVALSAVVGTSLFATLSGDEVSQPLRLVIGSISVVAAILTALQTFFRFAERTERHVIAADWYSALRRQIETVLALPRDQREPPDQCLERVRKEMSKISQQAPEIGQHLWEKTARKHGVRDRARAGAPEPP